MLNSTVALIYCENTDAGDPVNSVDTRFFFSWQNAKVAMDAAFEATDAIMHYTSRTPDESHFIRRTTDEIYIKDGADSMRWVIQDSLSEDSAAVIQQPLTLPEAFHMQEQYGEVRGNVSVPTNVLLNENIDVLESYVAEHLVAGSLPRTVFISLTPLAMNYSGENSGVLMSAAIQFDFDSILKKPRYPLRRIRPRDFRRHVRALLPLRQPNQRPEQGKFVMPHRSGS